MLSFVLNFVSPRHVNDGIKKWILKQEETRQLKDTVELPFRPFLRWLDRNLEALFIDAGRKVGSPCR